MSEFMLQIYPLNNATFWQSLNLVHPLINSSGTAGFGAEPPYMNCRDKKNKI